MEILQTYTFVIVLGITGVVVALVFYSRWKRRQALAQLAGSMGLAFLPEGPDMGALGATGLELFRLGHARKAANLISVESRSGAINFFDYRYTTGGGKNSQLHKFTLALMPCPGCAVPHFDLKPETFIHKIGEAIGFKDIDLPAFPLFSDKYRLTGPDETAVHMFFTPRRAAWFERNPGLRLQGAPGHVVLFKKAGQLPVADWQNFMEEVKAFAAEVLV
ncbi:MAG: hypothetical protein A2234_03855 [Elusimicrobia bacterium RIFOXYA2_FULL_58_8]|nr:MAG: hypothetical protein A2285_04890 [Elusimicrobia bacterium RIFOXYA12_FULL_57_11]OGS13531.1 MAG: hypothetical protein A2234_03855 [Elusimicrobia bacterium RIFOXYA2_FULL_58_8]